MNRFHIPPKLLAYIELVRPFTLLAPVIGGTSAALMGASLHNFAAFNIRDLVYGVSTLALVNMASNALNASYDVGIDRINKPGRPIPSNRITRDEARTLAFFLYIFTAWRVANMFNPTYGLMVVILILITIAYSMPPLRLKRRAWLNNISIAMARGLFGFVAGWAIFHDPLVPFNPTPWFIGAILCIFLIGATTSKDFTDVDGDRKFRMRTLPVVYGMRGAVIFTAPFFLVPFPLIYMATIAGYLPPTSLYLIPLAGWGAIILLRIKETAEQPDPRFENSPVWVHMYLLLMALQVGFAVTYILPKVMGVK